MSGSGKEQGLERKFSFWKKLNPFGNKAASNPDISSVGRAEEGAPLKTEAFKKTEQQPLESLKMPAPLAAENPISLKSLSNKNPFQPSESFHSVSLGVPPNSSERQTYQNIPAGSVWFTSPRSTVPERPVAPGNASETSNTESKNQGEEPVYQNVNYGRCFEESVYENVNLRPPRRQGTQSAPGTPQTARKDQPAVYGNSAVFQQKSTTPPGSVTPNRMDSSSAPGTPQTARKDQSAVYGNSAVFQRQSTTPPGNVTLNSTGSQSAPVTPQGTRKSARKAHNYVNATFSPQNSSRVKFAIPEASDNRPPSNTIAATVSHPSETRPSESPANKPPAQTAAAFRQFPASLPKDPPDSGYTR